jgi:hypothetical protein
MTDVDDLALASARGRPLAIDHSIGGFRPMAHLFVTDDGLAFADHGWDSRFATGTHPFHAVDGRVRRAGAYRWMIDLDDGGQAEIMPMNEDDLRRAHLDAWAPGDRARCLAAIQGSIAPSARDVPGR